MRLSKKQLLSEQVTLLPASFVWTIVVLAGHNNINGEVFRDLVNVEIGDKVIAYAGDKKFEYEITFKTIVKEKGEPLEVRQRNAQWIAPTNDERLTLVTCWPYTSNTHRLIVVAKPI